MTNIKETLSLYKQEDDTIEKLSEEISTHRKEQRKYYKELYTYIIENKLYLPIDKLIDYKGIDIAKITLVLGDGTTDSFIDCYDILEITDEGRFNLSDYESGLIEWNSKKNYYERVFCGSAKKMDIIGFFDLSKQIAFRPKEVFEETTMEYLINNCKK